MPIKSLQAIVDDFTVHRMDPASVGRCFTAATISVDGGETRIGGDAMRLWSVGSSTRYRLVGEPLATGRGGDRAIATRRFAGDFTDGPVDLRHALGLVGDNVARPEITP